MAYTRQEAERYGQLGLEAFQKRNRELLASFNGEQVNRALVAWTRLHKQEEILTHLTTADPDLSFFANHLEEGFLTLLDEGKLQPEASITELGQKVLVEMRRRTSIYNGEAPEPETKSLSLREQLETRVAEDFQKLPSKVFRQNCASDKKYRDAFDRLAAENRLGANQVTSAVLAGA